ncbi:MAG: DMT family transporter [Chloroflexi bacterium]|nr:DMT family transporter [Chloroflexota bacterium]
MHTERKTPQGGQDSRLLRFGFILAFAAAFSYAVASVLVRQHVGSSASPIIGAAISLFVGMATLAPFALRDSGQTAIIPPKRKGVMLFAVSGLATASGVTLLYMALDRSPLVIVSPLISLNPLVTMVLAHIFLRRLEKVTLRSYLGVVLVIAGAILVSVG